MNFPPSLLSTVLIIVQSFLEIISVKLCVENTSGKEYKLKYDDPAAWADTTKTLKLQSSCGIVNLELVKSVFFGC